jgi:hypothetical protein
MWHLRVAAKLCSFDIFHRDPSLITAVYANVRRQKSVCLRKGDLSAGAIRWNCSTTNLDVSPPCTQACFQATFKRVKE